MARTTLLIAGCVFALLIAASSLRIPVREHRTAFLAVLVLAASGCAAVGRYLTKRKVSGTLSQRPPLSAPQWATHFFGDSQTRQEVATRVREIFAKHIGVDLAGLRPEDQFERDLLLSELDSLANVDFVIDLEQDFGIHIPNNDAERMMTIADVIDYLHARLATKRTS